MASENTIAQAMQIISFGKTEIISNKKKDLINVKNKRVLYFNDIDNIESGEAKSLKRS